MAWGCRAFGRYVSLASLATQRNPFKRPPHAHLQRQGLRIEGKRILVE